ncbi:MAG: hypothetical protein E3J81_07160 [Dehalococcoidia bacterium]|nr:MAG: hypothetical protein E3J81_07160 [Dehalococcoidia bacterium]
MLRNRFIIGVVLLVLLGAIAGCGVGSEQSSEMANTLTIQGRVVVDAYHYDEATGTYVRFYHHESSNLIVTIGKDWIAQQLGGSPDSNPAKWISLSLDGTAPVVGWTQIPTEIAAGGLTRADGTYSHTGGTNTWEIEATFSATATHTDVQLTGLQYAVSGDNNLMAAKQFTAVTLNDGDALTVTWQLSLT